MQQKVSQSQATTNEIFGSFFLGGHEFALPIAHIQEVVNPSESYTPVPLAPAYLLGMFNLRGSIIPLVDLRLILNLPTTTNIKAQKIAIMEYGSFSVGLLFDEIGEIFKSQPEERSDFEFAANDSSQSVVCGAFKRDEGRRLVQILDIKALLQLQHVPHQKNLTQAHLRESHLNKRRGLRKQCISFLVGPSRCALSIHTIQEILKVDHIASSVFTSDKCLGTIELRGHIVPVIDMASLFGYGKNPDQTSLKFSIDSSQRILVMRLENELFGLLVDSVESIVPFFEENLIAFPVLGKEKSEMFLGCITRDKQEDIILLNPVHILSNSEVNEITQGHSQLYNSKKHLKGQENQRQIKKTYITFRLESLFAIRIEEVREIIDQPEILMHPPGLSPHIQGVLNLRGELVAIINARKMYNMQTVDHAQSGKVLIFQKENLKYGLVIDSVEAITHFSDENKMKLPSMYSSKDSGGMTHDVSEAVRVERSGEETLDLLILNLEMILQRVGISKVS